VEVFGGAVRVNGTYVSEPYRPEPIDYLMPPFTVPEGEVFVLGDNANWSVDSHNWNARYQDDSEVVPGGVPERSLVGRVRYVYLPPRRSGPVKGHPVDTLMAP
jgi:signal peptidase I